MKHSQNSMSRRLCFIVLLLVALSFAATAQNASLPIECVVTKLRKVNIEGGDFDDKIQRATFQITVTNKSLSQAVGPLQLIFYVFGVSVHDSKAFKLVQKETYDFSLEPRAVFQQKTPTVSLKFDTTGASFGETIRGWMLQILDEEGGVVLDQFSMPIIADSKNLASLQVDSYYKKDGQKIPPPERPRR